MLKYDSNTETVSWLFDPVEIWNEIGTSLAQNTFELQTILSLLVRTSNYGYLIIVLLKHKA